MTLKDINNATKEELLEFSGIGDKNAEGILEVRPINKWAELKEVPHITDRILKNLQERDSRKNNPNLANGCKPDPREAEFLKNYLNPKSPTYSNAKQSALKAGYSESYALNITNLLPNWLSESIEHAEVAEQAFENLREFLKEEENSNIKWKSTKFALENLMEEVFGKNLDITSGGKSLSDPELSEEQKQKLAEEISDKYIEAGK